LAQGLVHGWLQSFDKFELSVLVYVLEYASNFWHTLKQAINNEPSVQDIRTMLDIHLLKTFLAVAAGSSFRKAAEILHYAPSTVTAQIKALEAELGTPVFDRVGRTVLITEFGQRLVHHARRLVDLEAETRRLLSRGGEGVGELSVRISESLGILCLPTVLARFREQFPGTRLTLGTASRQDLAHDLKQGATDVALLVGEPFAASHLNVEVLCRERLAVIAPPDSKLAGRRAVRPVDLGGMTLFLTRYVWSARRLIEEALLEAGVSVAGLVECTSVEIVKRCVLAGLGLSVVPEFIVEEEARQGRLAVLEWAGGPLMAPVSLVRHEDRWLSPAAHAFMEAVREFFTARAKDRAGQEVGLPVETEV
jgi:DNA-binding transcriptional LysR family regulator